MKKLFLCVVLILSFSVIFSSCKKEETVIEKEDKKTVEHAEEKETFPKEFAREYWFSNGVGGWSTHLIIRENGKFRGQYVDNEMGVSGDDFIATMYVCNFKGEFELLEKIDKNSYKVKLVTLESEKPDGEMWIEDEVRYIASTPYGIDGGDEFILYTPDTKTKDLDEEFLFWWPKSMEMYAPDTLTQYAIHNLATNEGFFGD